METLKKRKRTFTFDFEINVIIADQIVNRRPTKFKIMHLQLNPDSMKPA